MDPVMKQVAVLREEVRLARLIVIRADQCVDLGLGGEPLYDATERVGLNAYIGVKEVNDFARGFLHAAIARRGRPTLLGGPNDAVTVPLGNFRRSVGRAIINDDAFVVAEVGLNEIAQTALKVRSGVVNRDDDGKCRSLGLAGSQEFSLCSLGVLFKFVSNKRASKCFGR
jgi:hypothetical protein